ncbi:hypothetical protein PDK24_28185 [Bacillus cereus]|nr:hypothetical protein [Bacillus cereus]
MNTIMKGVNGVLGLLGKGFGAVTSFLSDGFNSLIDLLAKPLTLLFYLLDGIFYFFNKMFQIVVMVMKIFYAFFQFGFSVIKGIYRTIDYWTHFTPSGNTNLPNWSTYGFKVAVEQVQGTGLMTVVPMVATGFVLLFFTIKMIGLWGGQIMIRPFGSGGSD